MRYATKDEVNLVQLDRVYMARLWCDDSEDSDRLFDLLAARGYTIQRIWTGGASHVFEYGGHWAHGWNAITAAYVMGRPEIGSA